MYLCVQRKVDLFTYLQEETPFACVIHVPPFLQPSDRHDEPENMNTRIYY